MQRRRWLLVLAITAILPAVVAYAADTTAPPQPDAAGSPAQPQAAAARNDAPPPPAESRATGQNLNVGTASAYPPSGELRYGAPLTTTPAHAEGYRFGFATGGTTAFVRADDPLYEFPGSAAGGTGLKLIPSPAASRPGWELSGRVGPLRFLSPLDSEGETKMRLGGRLPGQPRMPGMGLFNVGIHYNFE